MTKLSRQSASSFEQNTMFAGKRQGHRGALVEQLGRRTAYGQLAPRPMNDVLDKVAVKQTLANRSRSTIGRSVRCDGTHVDIRGADRDMAFVAIRRVRGPGLKRQPGCNLEIHRTRCRRGGGDTPRNQIGRADKIRDEPRFWAVVDVLRGADLLDPTDIHHDNPIRYRQRLFLVMSDIEGGDPEPTLQRPELDPHLGAQLGVEVG